MKCLDIGGLFGLHMSGNKITGSPRQAWNSDLIVERFWQDPFQTAVDFFGKNLPCKQREDFAIYFIPYFWISVLSP